MQVQDQGHVLVGELEAAVRALADQGVLSGLADGHETVIHGRPHDEAQDDEPGARGTAASPTRAVTEALLDEALASAACA